MPEKTLNIKNPETARLARKLAAREGKSITESITGALRDRLERLERQAGHEAARAAVGRIQAMVAGLPELDARTSDEIIGYDDYGLPA